MLGVMVLYLDPGSAAARFLEQVGILVRPYGLWPRLLRAMRCSLRCAH